MPLFVVVLGAEELHTWPLEPYACGVAESEFWVFRPVLLVGVPIAVVCEHRLGAIM